jgi:hypothetical protein
VLVIAVSSLLEEAVVGLEGTRNLSGNVGDIAALLRDPASVEALEDAHGGYLAYLAFDPAADGAVTDYLAAGSLPADSGPDALVLFTLQRSAGSGPVDYADLIGVPVQVEYAVLPARVVLRDTFPGDPPALPGLLVLPRLADAEHALYVPLGDATTAAEVRLRLRRVFALADESWADVRGDRDRLVASLGSRLTRARVPYLRGGRRSSSEWFVRLMAAATFDRVVAVLGLLKP